MAFPSGSQPVYAPESEHKLRQMQALVRAVYSTTAGSTTRGPLTATVAVPKAADARDTAAHGEGEEGEVHEYAEGEGEHGIGHADASGKVAVASGVPIDEHSAEHLEAAVKVQDLGEAPHEDLDFVPDASEEPSAFIEAPDAIVEAEVVVDFVPEPGAVLGSLKKAKPLADASIDAAIDKMKKWLKKQRLTKAIAYFEENEVDLDSMLELTEEQFEEWVSELPLDTMQKMRLRKGVAKLRVETKTESADDSDDANESEALLKSSAAPVSLLKSATTSESDFIFDVFTRNLSTATKFLTFSADLKTATPQVYGFASAILSPIMEGGTHELHFFIKTKPWRKKYISVGLRNAFGGPKHNKEMVVNFEHNGQVFSDDDWHRTPEDDAYVQYDFGGWQKNDHIKVVADLDNDKASIHTPYGDMTVNCKSHFSALRFCFLWEHKITISIV